MMKLDTEFFKHAVSNSKCYGKLKENSTFSFDSRTIQPGQLFIALKGEKVDGHDYVIDAIKKGASGVIIRQDKQEILESITESEKKNLFIGLVINTNQALLNLAGAWRLQLDCPIVGITGSIGKTSTKEILANILTGANVSYFASYANKNTLLSLAVNILKVKPENKVAIFEMGISSFGEMDKLVALAKPNIAVITNIAHSHIEGLGSLNDIAREKLNIFKFFKENNIGIINGDVPILNNISYAHPIIRFGLKTTNQIQARKIQLNSNSTNFILKIYNERYKVTLNSNHEGRIINSLAAAAVANVLLVPSEYIVKGLEVPLAIEDRFENLAIKDNKGNLINDCYNANPESMKAALLAFEKMESKGKKIAVLGDMLELGINSPFWHRQLGRFLRKISSLDQVILVGNNVGAIKSTMPTDLKVEHVKDWQAAFSTLYSQLSKDDLILIKGSQGMQLSQLVNKLTSN
jgi:UDP-N-acetylmuramoyl-tripeptide--D-alanyl-D-alanine ligase